MHYVVWNKIDLNYMVCGRRFPALFHNTPPRPGLFLSDGPKFLELARSLLDWARNCPKHQSRAEGKDTTRNQGRQARIQLAFKALPSRAVQQFQSPTRADWQ